MEFTKYFILEGRAQVSAFDETVLDRCSFVVNWTTFRMDDRTVDEILDSAANQEFEVRFLLDMLCGNTKLEVLKDRCMRKMEDRADEKKLAPKWIDVEYKAQIYVPRNNSRSVAEDTNGTR